MQIYKLLVEVHIDEVTVPEDFYEIQQQLGRCKEDILDRITNINGDIPIFAGVSLVTIDTISEEFWLGKEETDYVR